MIITKCLTCGYEKLSSLNDEYCTKKDLFQKVCGGKLEIIAQEKKKK